VIKVVLIDDHSLVRIGFRHMVEAEKTIQVVGEAGTGAEGIQLVRSTKPDVVILDIRLPDISGLEVAHKILAHSPAPKILVVSAMNDELFPLRMLEAGVHGYMSKNSNLEEFIRAIKTVYSDKRFISSEIAQQLALAKLSSGSKGDFSQLSDRETEVMLMVIHGVEVKEIAKKLHLSAKTVHSYRSRIFEKLNVKNDTALTLLAIKQGIISIEEAG
jgi:two-component system, NarL family, invasion response regulator UvrY